MWRTRSWMDVQIYALFPMDGSCKISVLTAGSVRSKASMWTMYFADTMLNDRYRCQRSFPTMTSWITLCMTMFVIWRPIIPCSVDLWQYPFLCYDRFISFTRTLLRMENSLSKYRKISNWRQCDMRNIRGFWRRKWGTRRIYFPNTIYL